MHCDARLKEQISKLQRAAEPAVDVEDGRQDGDEELPDRKNGNRQEPNRGNQPQNAQQGPIPVEVHVKCTGNRQTENNWAPLMVISHSGKVFVIDSRLLCMTMSILNEFSNSNIY